jgi:hypothetical protein
VPLAVDRGGIEIAQRDHFYVDLVDHLDIHSGSAIYAGPDARRSNFYQPHQIPHRCSLISWLTIGATRIWLRLSPRVGCPPSW